jgi:hypothetical protein
MAQVLDYETPDKEAKAQRRRCRLATHLTRIAAGNMACCLCIMAIAERIFVPVPNTVVVPVLIVTVASTWVLSLISAIGAIVVIATVHDREDTSLIWLDIANIVIVIAMVVRFVISLPTL